MKEFYFFPIFWVTIDFTFLFDQGFKEVLKNVYNFALAWLELVSILTFSLSKNTLN